MLCFSSSTYQPSELAITNWSIGHLRLVLLANFIVEQIFHAKSRVFKPDSVENPAQGSSHGFFLGHRVLIWSHGSILIF